MHDPAYELPRIHIPRTRVNRGRKKGRVPLQKHCARCGCRESHLASYHNSHLPMPGMPVEPQVRPLQQSPSSSQREPMSAQQVLPFWQSSPKQHSSPAAQEPPVRRQSSQKGPPVMPNGLQIPLQHSLSAVHGKPLLGLTFGVQHLPLAQIVPLQH
jgi:hypothetical protein